MHDCLILGSGRSGTSMVAGSLARAGYFMGDRLYPGRDANPLGFFEDPEINGTNEALLEAVVPPAQALGPMQRWLAALPRSIEPVLPPPLHARVRRLVARRPFCFKDPRFCYTLPAWRAELGRARFVCVFRDPAATAASILKECATAGYLRGVRMDVDRALDLWCAMYRQVLDCHRHEGQWLFLHYDQVLAGRGLVRLGEFLEAPIDASFPREELRRSRPTAMPTLEARRIYGELCRLAGHAEGASASEATRSAVIAPPTPERPPQLSVLICTYRRKKVLLECLEALSKQTLAADRFEIVVVVDGDEDGSAEAARDFSMPASLRVVARRKNAGLSSARSAALAAARGELVLLINDDTIAQPDLLERHLEAHARRAPDSVAVLGTFEQPEEQLGTALMRVLERTTFVFGYADLRPDVPHDWTKFWGCNVSFPRRVALEAGAFDAGFRHYGCEDTDLGVRLFERGLPVHFEPRARAWHRHVLSFDDLERRQKTVARAYVRFFAKHPQRLDHPSWKGVGLLTLEQLETSVKRRAPVHAKLRVAASALAGAVTCDLAALGGQHAELAAAAEKRLEHFLTTLDRQWWDEGFAEGLRALGFASFRELRSLRDPAAAPWPIAIDAPFKLLAWPRWDRDEELAALVELAADERLESQRPCLCLRHDPRHDGDAATAIERLERVSRKVLQGGPDVDAVILGEPMEQADLPRLRRAVTCALLLESSEDEARARFFARAGTPGVRGIEDLLAFVPVTQRPQPAARVWAELSV